jgi:hypothetical protein
MSKKDYIKFAAMLKEQHDIAQDTLFSQGKTAVENVIKASAEIFAEDNPRFDHDRFYKACGMD